MRYVDYAGCLLAVMIAGVAALMPNDYWLRFLAVLGWCESALLLLSIARAKSKLRSHVESAPRP